MKQIIVSVFSTYNLQRLEITFLISSEFRIKFYQIRKTISYSCQRKDRKIGGKII